MTKIFNPSSFIPSNSIFKYPQDENMSIKDRGLTMFRDIIGLEQIKVLCYRPLLHENRSSNILLIGAAATGKTDLLKIIEDNCNGVLFYDAASGSTGAGLFEILRRNKKAKILIIDELSELKKNEIDMIRGLAASGRVSKTLKTDNIDFTMKGLKIYATTNNPTKLSLPIKSRFQIFHIDPYTDEEIIRILEYRLVQKGIVDNTEKAKALGHIMLHYGIRDIRKIIQICNSIHKDDNNESIVELIESYVANDGSNVNINYNEVG